MTFSEVIIKRMNALIETANKNSTWEMEAVAEMMKAVHLLTVAAAPGREAIARIIDATPFDGVPGADGLSIPVSLPLRRADALAKADAILALAPAATPGDRQVALDSEGKPVYFAATPQSAPAATTGDTPPGSCPPASAAMGHSAGAGTAATPTPDARASALARRLCQLFDSGGESQRTVRARHASAIFQLLNSEAPEFLAEQAKCDKDPVGYLEASERCSDSSTDKASLDLCASGVDPGWDACPKCGATMDDECAMSLQMQAPK